MGDRRQTAPGLFHPRYWGSWLGVGLYWLVSRLPVRLRMRLGARVGDLHYRTSEKRRRISGINLRIAFPELDEAERRDLQRRFFRRAGQAMLDYGALAWHRPEAIRHRIRVQGREHLEQARREGKGVILLTAHSVGLDAGALYFSLIGRVAGPFKPARNPVANWLMARLRTRFGTEVFARDEGLRPLIRAVKGGRLLYYIPDEDLGAKNAVFAPYFGVEKATIATLGRLARMCDAEIIPCMTWIEPERGGYRVVIEEPLAGLASDDEATAAARMNRAMEAMLRERPDQYMWGMRFFNTRPEGQGSPYRHENPLPERVDGKAYDRGSQAGSAGLRRSR